MMAKLVAERFLLRYHLEKGDLAVYAITADHGEPHLALSHSDPNTTPSLGFRGRGELVARNSSIADLAWELQSAVLARPVVDQSGLAADSRTADTAPSLFTAIRQQLGLTVTSTRANVIVMVIDHIALPDRD